MRGRARVVLGDAVGATAVATTVFLLLLLSGGIWAHVGGSDLHGMFVPRYYAAARAVLREHRLPLWNPWELCGAPLLGSGQAAALYPPVLVIFSTLSSWSALQALYAFHVLVLAWGMLAYLRRHAVGRVAATLGAVIAVAGVVTIPGGTGVDHPSFLGSVAWVPFMLVAWERAVADGASPWLGALALAIAMQWLAGYPEFAMDTPVLLALVAVLTPAGTLARRLGMLAAGLALGSALAAVQILPLGEAVAQSTRAGGAAFESLRQGLAWTSIRGLLGAMHVAGVAAGALLVGVALGSRRRVVLGWVLAVVWATFALQPPFNWLYHLPPYTGVRFPLAWSALAPLFLGFLVAVGASTGARRRERTSTPGRPIVVALALLTAASAARAVALAPRMFDEGRVHVDVPDPGARARRARSIERGLEHGGPRFIAGLDVRLGTPLRSRLRSAGGYEPAMPPRRIGRLLDEAGIGTVGRPRWWLINQHPRLVDRLGVGTLVLPAAFAAVPRRRGFATMATLANGDVVLAKPGLPRARIVHAVARAASADDALRLVLDPRVAAQSTVVLEGATAPAVVPPPRGSTERLRVEHDEPEHLAFAVELASDGLVALTDTWAPGWLAEVDGAPAEVLRADYAFRAVAVPAGKHRLVLRYRPRSIVVGGLVTFAAAGLVLLLLLPPLPAPVARSSRAAGRRSESRS